MAKKILINIALDGDAEIKRKLQDVADSGKRSFDTAGITKNLGNEIGGLSGKIEQAVSSGLSKLPGGGGILGGLISKLTSPGGILAGIGATITGSLIASSKQIDEQQRVRGRLAALGDPKGFERLTTQAKAAGEDVSNLQSRYENFLQFQQKFNAGNAGRVIKNPFVPTEDQANEEALTKVDVISGGKLLTPPSRQDFGKFDNSLLAQIRRDVKSSEEANQIAGQFQGGLLSGGLTPDLLRSLPPNARNFVTEQIGKSSLQRFANPEELIQSMQKSVLGPGRVRAGSILGLGADEQGVPSIDAGAAIRAIAKPNPAFEKAARESRSPGQALEAFTNASRRQFEPTEDAKATNKAIGGFLDNAAKRIDASQLPPPLGIPAGVLGTYFNKDTQLPLRPESSAPASFDARFNAVSGAADKTTELGTAVSGTTSALSTFQEALTQVAAGLRSLLTIPVNGKTEKAPALAGGGSIRGPGSGTSDNIPIMVSNGEYIVSAKGTSKAGLAHLDWINAGMPGYAGGGLIPDTGSLEVTPTDDGGAIINGNYVPPGSPILQDPRVKQALAKAYAARGQDDGGRRKHKSDFVGLFGGHNFDTPGSYAKGGAVGRGIPHFAFGGMADVPDLVGAAPSVSDTGGGSASSPWSDIPHLGSMDWNSHLGQVRVVGPAETLRHMQSAARDAADVQTGQRPTWYRGRS